MGNLVMLEVCFKLSYQWNKYLKIAELFSTNHEFGPEIKWGK